MPIPPLPVAHCPWMCNVLTSFLEYLSSKQMRHNLDNCAPGHFTQTSCVRRVLAECTVRHAALRSFHLRLHLHVFALCSAPEWGESGPQLAFDLAAFLFAQRHSPASCLHWLTGPRRAQKSANCWMRLNLRRVTAFQKKCTSFFQRVGPQPRQTTTSGLSAWRLFVVVSNNHCRVSSLPGQSCIQFDGLCF